MKNLKYLFVICSFCMFFTYTAIAQDETEESPLSVNADFVSTYIWRGMTLSSSPNFQPSITYSIGGFYAGTWGSTDFTGDYKELDLLIGYSIGPMSFTIYDYFSAFPNEYFNYNNEETSHSLELELLFEPEKFPVRFQAATFFYGADKKYYYDTTITDLNKNNFSTYLELGYNFDLKGNTLYPFVGITPFNGMYGTDLAVVNAGITASREIQITDRFSLPISVSGIFNPHTQDYFCIFTLSL